MSSTFKPSQTAEGREQQLINAAYNLAAQRIEDGSATAGEIMYFLKMGSQQTRLQNEVLSLQRDLVQAKTEALKAQRKHDELYAEAIAAFKVYSGHPEEVDNNDQDVQ